MQIDDALIDKLAHLARLEFEGEKKEKIKADLTRILAFCEQLNQIDTTGVEPLIYMSNSQNILRDDIVADMLTKEEALQNAPKADSDYFKVPRFIEK